MPGGSPRLDAPQHGLRGRPAARAAAAPARALPLRAWPLGCGGAWAAAEEHALRDAGGPGQAKRGRHLAPGRLQALPARVAAQRRQAAVPLAGKDVHHLIGFARACDFYRAECCKAPASHMCRR